MHEMAITQSVVDICLEHSAGKRVLSVTMEIGALSGVVPEAVEFCFAACSQETLLEGARLEIITIDGVGRCRACGSGFARKSLFDACPACGSYGVEQVAGEELRVRDLEIEDDP